MTHRYSRLAALLLACAAVPAALAAKPTLSIVDARSTTKEQTLNGTRVQIVEATIENDDVRWIRPNAPATVSVQVSGARTVAPATISWLAPGERAFVEIGIANDPGVAAGTKATGKIVTQWSGSDAATLDTPLVLGVAPYTSDPASLQTHEAPDWFNDAKFGIFIHWGVYSVPAFSRVGDYAEWYWHSIHEKDSVDYKHQLALHGPNSNYDDFIPQFTAEHFDPKAWVDLFHAAGARYFVLTSKHHEGFALFTTTTTNRDAVDMGPHRDLVGALFAAARKYYPNDLHPGLYYSLYEWYNPAFTGKPVPQWYSGAPVPYTGMKPIASYVDDHMLPQMHEIVAQYHPQVLWCDGEWEKPSEYWHDAGLIAYYYNQARDRDEGVAIDDRCRVTGGDDENKNVVFDFSTPEYTTFSHTRAKKWEASRGMGYSYGYNAAEQPKD
jgi:alpha-L-fucosidase